MTTIDQAREIDRRLFAARTFEEMRDAVHARRLVRGLRRDSTTPCSNSRNGTPSVRSARRPSSSSVDPFEMARPGRRR